MAFLIPYPKFIATNQSTGARLSGALLYTYLAGTDTPAATYTDSTGATANANPVVCDSNGEADVWCDPANLYKWVLKTSAGVTQWTEDNLGAGSTYGQTSFAVTLLAAANANAARVVLGFPNIAAKGALIVGTAANTLGALAAATSDAMIPVSQSSQTTGILWSTQASAPANGPVSVTSYPVAGTYTYTCATTTIGRIKVYCVGSGGGGATGSSAGGGGGGGGGGCAIWVTATSVSMSTAAISTAAGGAATAAGGSSAFGTSCVATGGAGGAAYGAAPIAGGIGTAGNILFQGGAGGQGIGSAANGGGGMGGNSLFGGCGGGGGAATGTGGNGGQYGGGGGGGYLANSGGSGGGGIVIIEEYAL